ncbi:MFS transporter [Actinoplanes couchii]|uniref:MFS transporter n=1 Tax=Actinoplanes couchii TaxID=403638 RepID=UPI0019412F06|nr:MFS transporter [Actinoplanes couchii]MDR6323666.1 MFS family permease [Actinoplanes couchii]
MPALVGRLSYGILFLAVMLAVVRATGSYSVAGVLVALFGLSSAVLSPVRARFIDRYGLRRALPPMVVVYVSALAAIAVATWRPGTSVADLPLYVLAVLAGSSTPPLGPIMRSIWSDLLPDPDLRQRAFSVDTVAEETLYIVGPLVAGAVAAIANPALGVALSAALILTGSLLLITSPAVKHRAAGEQRQTPGDKATPAPETGGSAPFVAGVAAQEAVVTGVAASETVVSGAAVHEAVVTGAAASETVVSEAAAAEAVSGLRVLAHSYRPIVISAAVGMCLGALSLLVVAFAQNAGRLAAVAWIEAALAVGSVVGGLAYGAVTWRLSEAHRLRMLAAGLGVTFALSGLAGNLYLLAGCAAVIGLFVSPALSTAYLLADESATPETRIQAGAWVNTAFNLANSAGTALVGLLLTRLPLAVCFALAAAPPLLAAVVTVTRSPGTVTRSAGR